MDQPFVSTSNTTRPEDRPTVLARSIALMKPVTWFAPTWAFLCGVIASAGAGWNLSTAVTIVLGMVMAGPILCGSSQVINDYFDREIDAVNEPDRLIPSGMISLGQVFLTALVLMVVGAAIALYLSIQVFFLAVFGLLLALIYSAPPFRLKRNGWIGNAVVGVSYEGLAWLAGHLALAPLTPESLLLAGVYSIGTHGIMSINDYKSIEGDRLSGIRTIPVQLGPERTAWFIVGIMNLAQVIVIALFAIWGQWITTAVLIGILIAQLPVQRHFVQQPDERYLKFSAIGVTFFVWGMMVAAIGLSAMA